MLCPGPICPGRLLIVLSCRENTSVLTHFFFDTLYMDEIKSHCC